VNKHILTLCFGSLLLLSSTGCESIQNFFNEPQKQREKLHKENNKLKQEVNLLNKQLAQAQAEGVVNKVLVSLYDLRHAVEKYALKNEGKYPVAKNINELQSALKDYLPETFEIEAIYLETVSSKKVGYIMIASVKGQKIVVSNIL